MIPQSPKASCHDAVQSLGFGMTIFIINGGIECGANASVEGTQEAQNRIDFYLDFCQRLGVSQKAKIFPTKSSTIRIEDETGHTLGFPHEHLRRELVERIDRDKAIAFYQKNLKWKPEKVIRNVLTPLEESSIMGTTRTDSTSIMCYQIPGRITKDGNPIVGGTEISSSDYEFVAQIYPKPSASDRAIVYTDSEYQGFGQTLVPGKYDWGQIHNDVISSVKVPAGRKAIFYSDVNFSGQTKTFTADTPYVGNDFNDRTSSIVIE